MINLLIYYTQYECLTKKYVSSETNNYNEEINIMYLLYIYVNPLHYVEKSDAHHSHSKFKLFLLPSLQT